MVAGMVAFKKWGGTRINRHTYMQNRALRMLKGALYMQICEMWGGNVPLVPPQILLHLFRF